MNALAALALVASALAAQDVLPQREMRTPAGVRFVLLGKTGSHPAPVVFLFGLSLDRTLTDPQFARVEEPLRKAGAIFVLMDPPSHGLEQPKGEANPLHDWRVRLERGDNFVQTFVKTVSAVLDELLRQGYADSNRIAVAGISRGGYLALHFAAAEPRVRAVAALAPVTDLLALREFDGMDENKLTQSLSAMSITSRLAGRRILLVTGSSDYRVDTRRTIGFYLRLTDSELTQGVVPGAELRVVTSRGHHLELEDYFAGGEWLAGILR